MRPSMILVAAALALPCVAADPEGGSDWRQWRGPTGTGFAPDGDPPVEWSGERNVRWKVEIAGAGHSSPIVLGNRIYLMTAVEADEAGGASGDAAPGRGGGGGRSATPTNVHRFVVVALDRADGSVVWRTIVREAVPHEGAHGTNTFASGSPVTDGEHIYAFFGSRGLFCLDLDGSVKWEKDLGDMRTRNAFGEGASPALHADTLVVPWDHEGDSFVAALDKRTGEQRWRAGRDEPTTWTTPVIVEVNGTPQVVHAGTNATVSYDLMTGEEIWRCSGLTANVIPTPVVGHGIIYLTSGFRGSALQAVRLDAARGDITGGEAIVWSIGRGTPYVPSPMLAGRNLYFLRGNNGIISCYDAITGESHYEGERLEAVRSVYASPVGAGGRVYVCGREGEVVVLEDGPLFKVLATNTLGEGIDASPAIAGDEIYLRGRRHLFCIARTEGE